MIAVKNNAKALIYLKNPSDAIKIAAIKHDPLAIRYISTLSKNVLNACKNELIKAILEGIRDGYIKFDAGNPGVLLNAIKDTGWPELGIIVRSLKANNVCKK